MISPLQEGPVSQTSEFKQSLDSFYVTDRPISVTNLAEMAMFYLNWPILMIFPLQEGPVSQTCEFKQSLDSFYVTDSPLSVTNIAEMALFYLNWPVLIIFPYRKCQLVKRVSLNKFLTVSMLQIVL